MIKLIVITLFLNLFTSFSYSQQLLLGVKGGVSMSNFRVSNDERNVFNNNSYRYTPTFGGMFHISVDDYVGLDLELNYTERGAKTSNNTNVKDVTGNTVTIYTQGEYRVTYFDLPVLLSLYIAADSKWRPKLYIGPSLNFMSAANLQSETSINNNGNQSGFYINDQKVTDRFKTFDLSVLVGGGINYKINTRTWLTFDIRYLNSIGNINTEKNYKADIQNRGIITMIGIAYSLAE